MDLGKVCREYPTSRRLWERAVELGTVVEVVDLPYGIGGLSDYSINTVKISSIIGNDPRGIPIFCHEMTHILQGREWFTVGELKTKTDLLSRAYLANKLLKEAEAYSVERQSMEEVMMDYPSLDWRGKSLLLESDLVDFINWAGPCGDSISIPAYYRKNIRENMPRMLALSTEHDKNWVV